MSQKYDYNILSIDHVWRSNRSVFYPFLFFISSYFFCGIEDSNL